MTRTVPALFSIFVAAACASTRRVPTSPPPSLDYDRAFVRTILEFDEQSDKLLAAAKFDATHPELRGFADTMGHAHEKRSTDLRAIRDRIGPPVVATTPIPFACASRQYVRPSEATGFDVALLIALIEHRQCLVALAEDATKNTRDVDVQTIAQQILISTRQELAKLTSWRANWSP